MLLYHPQRHWSLQSIKIYDSLLKKEEENTLSRENHMERCYAAMRFFGPTLDHRTVTAFLGREPSYAHLPGERRNRVGKPYPNGMWLLSSEKHVVSADLEDHIGWLLDQLEAVAHTLLPYLQSVGAKKDVDCYWEKEGNGGAFFHSSLLKRIAALDLALGVTMYSLDESGEEMETMKDS